MKFAYTIQLMIVKQNTKFQVIPISSFRVLADEKFSNVDTKFKSGKQEVVAEKCVTESRVFTKNVTDGR